MFVDGLLVWLIRYTGLLLKLVICVVCLCEMSCFWCLDWVVCLLGFWLDYFVVYFACSICIAICDCLLFDILLCFTGFKRLVFNSSCANLCFLLLF